MYNTVVRLCQLFCSGGKANLVRFTLFYSTLLTLTDKHTDRQTDRGTNTLASHGLEEPFFIYTRCAWAGGTFFSCAVVSVFGPGGKYVLVLHTTTYVVRVQYSCGVVLVFWFWREIVFGVTYILSVKYSCAVV